MFKQSVCLFIARIWIFTGACLITWPPLMSVFFYISCWKDSNSSVEFPQPPAIILFVMNVDDISGPNAQLVVHVCAVVVQGATGADAGHLLGGFGVVVDLADVSLAFLVVGHSYGRGWSRTYRTADESTAAATAVTRPHAGGDRDAAAPIVAHRHPDAAGAVLATRVVVWTLRRKNQVDDEPWPEMAMQMFIFTWKCYCCYYCNYWLEPLHR